MPTRIYGLSVDTRGSCPKCSSPEVEYCFKQEREGSIVHNCKCKSCGCKFFEFYNVTRMVNYCGQEVIE